MESNTSEQQIGLRRADIYGKATAFVTSCMTRKEIFEVASGVHSVRRREDNALEVVTMRDRDAETDILGRTKVLYSSKEPLTKIRRDMLVIQTDEIDENGRQRLVTLDSYLQQKGLTAIFKLNMEEINQEWQEQLEKEEREKKEAEDAELKRQKEEEKAKDRELAELRSDKIRLEAENKRLREGGGGQQSPKTLSRRDVVAGMAGLLAAGALGGGIERYESNRVVEAMRRELDTAKAEAERLREQVARSQEETNNAQREARVAAAKLQAELEEARRAAAHYMGVISERDRHYMGVISERDRSISKTAEFEGQRLGHAGSPVSHTGWSVSISDVWAYNDSMVFTPDVQARRRVESGANIYLSEKDNSAEIGGHFIVDKHPYDPLKRPIIRINLLLGTDEKGDPVKRSFYIENGAIIAFNKKQNFNPKDKTPVGRVGHYRIRAALGSTREKSPMIELIPMSYGPTPINKSSD